MTSKKIAYATLGTLMIVTAVLARLVWDGGPELVGLLIVGLMTLIASADLPQQSTKGRTR